MVMITTNNPSSCGGGYDDFVISIVAHYNLLFFVYGAFDDIYLCLLLLLRFMVFIALQNAITL
jgi:hypothetical protein